jgi:protein-S-isoprenylcysteine O-methyltransferase Ste14
MFVRNGLFILLALALFGAIHSLLAGARPKDRLKSVLDDRLVEGWYRLAYNAFSVVTLIPVGLVYLALPDQTLYSLGAPWSLLLRLLQVLGAVGLAGALFVTDVWHFAGLKQALAYLNGDPLPVPNPPLQEAGMYRFVRHPLYFFSLLAIWPTPTLTINGLWLNVGITLYFMLGSWVEERRLIRQYGDDYVDYRRRVSWLVPWFPSAPSSD